MLGKIILGIIILIGLWLVYTFNRLVTLQKRVKEAWADIEVQLKRRYNLIPNLIETVKGYASHEKEVFQKVTEARTKAISAQSVKEKAKAENFLASTLKSLFAVAERYPDLKAIESFTNLMTELRDTEDKILSARRFYNSVVRDFNIKIDKFPERLIAKKLGFKKAEFFEIEEAEAEKIKEVPRVKF